MAKVCLDPGHGVETPGKRSPDGTYRECEFTLDMARRIRPLLERHGVEVMLTRTNEHDVSLPRRVATANGAAGLDLFVSLHSNAGGNGSSWVKARGLVAYVFAADGDSTRAGQAIMDRQGAAGVTLRNGGKPADGSHLYVVRNTRAPAVLIEHLFHDNQADVALLKDPEWRQRMAEADARGILDYLGIEKEEDEDMTREETQGMIAEAVEKLKAELTEEVYDAPEAVPAWGRGTVQRLMTAGRLVGDGEGRLGLTPTLLRALVIMERGERVCR